MSYLRLDDRELAHLQKFIPPPAHHEQKQVLKQPIPQMTKPVQLKYNLPQPPINPNINIRGIKTLTKQIGYPDVTDHHRGGIAIWARDTLAKRGYKFLDRVEVIDEAIPSLTPVKHFSNVYIWVRLNLTENQERNIYSLSTDIFYDQGKNLLIVRSDTLDTAVAQASLVALYTQNKLSFYDIVSNNMHLTYYLGVSKKKTRKTLYTILNNITKYTK